MKYIRIDPEQFREGFITHEDQEQDGLSFEIVNDIVKVEGKDDDLLKWMDRVKGEEIDEKVAMDDLIKYEQDGIKAAISYHQDIVTELSAKVILG